MNNLVTANIPVDIMERIMNTTKLVDRCDDLCDVNKSRRISLKSFYGEVYLDFDRYKTSGGAFFNALGHNCTTKCTIYHDDKEDVAIIYVDPNDGVIRDKYLNNSSVRFRIHNDPLLTATDFYNMSKLTELFSCKEIYRILYTTIRAVQMAAVENIKRKERAKRCEHLFELIKTFETGLEADYYTLENGYARLGTVFKIEKEVAKLLQDGVDVIQEMNRAGYNTRVALLKFINTISIQTNTKRKTLVVHLSTLNVSERMLKIDIKVD